MSLFPSKGRLLFLVAGAALVATVPARAQLAEPFIRGVVDFANAVSGVYGDEGQALLASVDAMEAGLAQWDAAIAKVEAGLAAEIRSAPSAVAARMRTALGTTYLERGRLDDALSQFDMAAALDPTFAAVEWLRGVVHEHAGRRDAAASAYRRAARLDPAHPPIAYLVLRSAVAGTAAPDAAATKALLAAAGAAASSGAAIPRFPVLRALDESSAPVPLFLGARYRPVVAAFDRLEYTEAVAAAREHARTDPLVADSAARSGALGRASSALKGGDSAAAVAAATEARDAHPGSSEVHRILGLALSAAGRHDEAVQQLRTAVRLDAADERSYLAIADALVAAEQSAAARGVLAETSRAIPDSGLAQWKLGVLHRSLGDSRSAARSFEHAATIPVLAGASHIFAALGHLRHAELDLDGAASAYRARVQLAPNDAAAHLDLGDVLRSQGHLSSALAEYLVAALLDPTSARAFAAAGLVLASESRDDEAVTLLRRAIALESGHLEARYAVSRALLRLGKSDEARRELAIYQELQVKAMAEERRRFLDNQQRIEDALKRAPGTARP